MKNKLAIVVTHPIQYYAPVFKLLNDRNILDIKVFYTWGKSVIENKYDPAFGKIVQWDIPLLEGYNYHFTENNAKDKGSHHFEGIQNPSLIAEIEDWNPSTVLIYGWAYHSHLKLMRHFKGKIPVCFRGDSTLLDSQPFYKRFLKNVYLRFRVFRYVDKAFYVGTRNKEYFKNYGVKEGQLFFAPHAIDNARFAVDHSTEALKWRKGLGIKVNDLVVLFAGKFEPKKQPDLLLNVFVELNLSNCHLVFVGNGILEEKLKSIKEHSVNKDRIHFLDFQNQQKMPIIYQLADIFCLPSKGPGETWGLAVNEAMAAGKTILVSDKVGSAIDLVQNGKNGFIFNSNDTHDFKFKLRELLDKEKLIPFGKKSIMIINEWNFDKQVKLIEMSV